MNRNNQMGTFSMILFAIAALALYFLLTGCAPAATVARMDGFNSQWRGFEAVRGEPATKSAKITLEVIVGELQKGWAGSYPPARHYQNQGEDGQWKGYSTGGGAWP
jgi:hypothetical protein